MAGLWPLTGYYLVHFSSVGVTLPFLPAYFRSLHLSGTQIGVLLAMSPLLALLAPPLWGHLADRTGRPDRVLSAVALGACLGFAPVLWLQGFGPLVAAYVVYSFFASSITTVIDSLTLRRVEVAGGSYSRIRLFGSVGFVISSTAFGVLVSQVDVRAVWVALALMLSAFACSLAIRTRTAPAPAAHPLAGLRLLRERDVALLLACTALHWIACAPFHGSFAIHVTALGLPPRVVGLSAGLGVVAEIAVMFLYPRLFARVQPRHLISLSCAASAVRWLCVSLVDRGAPLVALQVIHGLTFGLFYIASVSYLARRAPPHLRASAQALYVAVTFGVGGLVGYTAGGAGYDALGGHRLFAAAAALELLPAALALLVRPPAPGVAASVVASPP
ncbi:MAG TPA: MFS transporter [Myxococcales bacterium]|nr:MFS transporter [Myxococcales bacterium]